MSEDTATAVRKQQIDNALTAAMNRLLDRLRRYMSVYPMTSDTVMPDHDLAWLDHMPDRNPAKEILDAIKANPVLWKDALPDEVCIVPRKALESLGSLTPEMVDYLAYSGANIVEGHAWRLRQEQEERDHLELAGQPSSHSI